VFEVISPKTEERGLDHASIRMTETSVRILIQIIYDFYWDVNTILLQEEGERGSSSSSEKAIIVLCFLVYPTARGIVE
jgi:hypothetical protein